MVVVPRSGFSYKHLPKFISGKWSLHFCNISLKILTVWSLFLRTSGMECESYLSLFWIPHEKHPSVSIIIFFPFGFEIPIFFPFGFEIPIFFPFGFEIPIFLKFPEVLGSEKTMFSMSGVVVISLIYLRSSCLSKISISLNRAAGRGGTKYVFEIFRKMFLKFFGRCLRIC